MKIVFALLLLIGFVEVNCQINYGGKPVGIKDRNIDNQLYVDTLQLDDKRLLKKTTKVPQKGESLHFAHTIHVNYTPENSGAWIPLNDGSKMWQLAISSPGAYSINLIFDRFVLPEGARLFVYNTDESFVLGAFTHKNNKANGILALTPVPGDELIIEYHPAPTGEVAELVLGAVNHDFLGIYDYLKAGIFGDAADCEVDVTCLEEEHEIEVKRSVCRILVDGTELCTGTLLNNTKDDGVPYFITAGHCFPFGIEDATVLFLFNYEVPKCSEIIEGAKSQTVSGAYIRAYAANYDFALLELSVLPPQNYRPYLAGWTLSDGLSVPLKTIHHPMGDVKKISYSNSIPYKSTFNAVAVNGELFEEDSHWRIQEWSAGTTEAGSSGAPIFDANERFFGTLSGGPANCASPRNDCFSRFNKVWDELPDASSQLKYWLDPVNSGLQQVDGRELYPNQKFVRLSNINTGDEAGVIEVSEGGFESGHNGLASDAVAEFYSNIGYAEIDGAYVMSYLSDIGNRGSSKVKISVWLGVEKPSQLIYTKAIEYNELGNAKENYIAFDSMVVVNGPFFIGAEFSYQSSLAALSLYQTKSEHVSGDGINYSFVRQNGVWNSFVDFFKYTNEVSNLWIDVLAHDVSYLEEPVEPGNEKLNLFLAPTDQFFYLELGDRIVKGSYLYDMNGCLVDRPEAFNLYGEAKVKLPNIVSGVYIYHLVTNEGTLVKKILIQNSAN